MNRLKGISLNNTSDPDSVKNIIASVFPKWAYANNKNSIAYTDISEAHSTIESTRNIIPKYSEIFTNGGFFDHHTTFTTTEIYNFPTTQNYNAFLAQLPSTYHLDKTFIIEKDIYKDIIAIDGAINYELEHFLIKGFNNEKTIYSFIDFNHDYVRNYKITESRKTVYTVTPPYNITYPVFITEEKNIVFNITRDIDPDEDDFTPEYLSSKNYSKRYDVDADGFISQDDLINYSTTHSVDLDSILFFKNAVQLTGWYITYKQQIPIKYTVNNYIGILDQEFIIESDKEIKHASMLKNEGVVILTKDGLLTIGDYSVNSLLLNDEKIESYDVSDNTLYFIVNNGFEKKLYRINTYTLVLEYIMLINDTYLSILVLPDDYIVFLNKDGYDVYKPFYNTSFNSVENEITTYYYLSDLNNNELYYPNTENTDDGRIIEELIPVKIETYELQTAKLQTYLDMLFQPFGIQRWYGESLYNFYSRFYRIINKKDIDFREIISEHLGMNPDEKPEILHLENVETPIPDVNSFVSITIDDVIYNLTYNDGDYTYDGKVICSFKKRIFIAYTTILRIPKYILPSTYMITVRSLEGMFFSFPVVFKINYGKNLTDLSVENVNDENVTKSSDIYNRNYDRIYKTHYVNKHIKNGLSEFDSFRSERFIQQGKSTLKYSDEHIYSLPKKSYGIYDGHSFGDHSIEIINTTSDSDVEILNSESNYDKYTIRELSNDGSTQIIKFACNSGVVVDDGEIKVYGTFAQKPYNEDYYRKIHIKENLIDGFSTGYPKISIDNNGFSYIYFTDILSNNNAVGINVYENTGRLNLYIEKQLISTGPVYVNLKKIKNYPGQINININRLNTFDSSGSLPFPKKFEVRFEDVKIEKTLYGDKDNIFSDTYFNLYPLTFYPTISDKDVIQFTNEYLPQSKPKTLYMLDNSVKNITTDIKNVYPLKEHVRSSEIELSKIYIDGLMVPNTGINSNKRNLIEYINDNSFIYRFDILQDSISLRAPTKEEVFDKIKNQVPDKYMLVDMFMFLTLYFDENVAGVDFHHKDKFFKCYFKNEGRREFLFLNNLFNITSHAYNTFAAMSAFRKDQKYSVIGILTYKDMVYYNE